MCVHSHVSTIAHACTDIKSVYDKTELSSEESTRSSTFSESETVPQFQIFLILIFLLLIKITADLLDSTEVKLFLLVYILFIYSNPSLYTMFLFFIALSVTLH